MERLEEKSNRVYRIIVDFFFKLQLVGKSFKIPFDPLYPPLLDPWDPDFGRTHDLVLQRFGQQTPPIVEHSLSWRHFGVQDDVWDDNGHSPKSRNKIYQ